MPTIIKEFFKEFARIWLLTGAGAVLPVLIGITQLPPEQIITTLKNPITWIVIATAFLGSIFKAADRAIHEIGSKLGDTSMTKSIARF